MDRAKQLGAGLALSTAVVGGGALVVEGAVNPTHDIAISTKHAEPSNMLGDGFSILEEAGAVLGSGVLLKRGLRNIGLAFDDQKQAINEVAHSSSKSKRLASVGLLTVFTGVVAGNFFNISDNVSKTQSNVASYFKELNPGGTNDKSYVISNTPVPNMLNVSNIDEAEIKTLDKIARNDNVSLIPIQHDWSGGSYSSTQAVGSGGYNLEFLTMGLPASISHIPQADANCNNVEVNASSQMGVRPGEFFSLQGLKVRVHDLIQGGAGFNLLPVVMDSKDFSRCLLTSSDPSYNMAIAQGNGKEMEHFLKNLNSTNNSPSNRLYAVTLDQFINNAENTGKNAVNGLVLEAMAIGMALGAIALNYKTSQDLANNRSRNSMLKANGYDEHLIMKIYKERSEADAVGAAVLAMPGTLIVDTLVNHAQPGGALGINIETFLAVTGFLWAISRISTSLSVRKEARLITNQRNGG